jgi:hypothetical protein
MFREALNIARRCSSPQSEGLVKTLDTLVGYYIPLACWIGEEAFYRELCEMGK